jgi:TolA-binding protein
MEAVMPLQRQRSLVSLIALSAALGLGSGRAVAQGQPSTEELMKQIKMLEQRLRSLEAQVQQQQQPGPPPAAANRAQRPNGQSSTQAAAQPQAVPAPAAAPTTTPASAPAEQKPPNKDLFGLAPSPIDGLKLGMYGELKFGTQQNPAFNGDWQSGFDAARLVLLLNYKFADSIVFNAEIEFEHAGAGFDNDDKLHGTAEVEQAYIDFLVSQVFNVRSPGIDLVPIGYINQHHEPTQFYSVNRPEIPNGRNNGLIPTTWAAPAVGIFGKLIDGLNYQIQVSTTLEDFGGGFDARTDANVVGPDPYLPGISGITGLNFARPPRGDFRQLSNYLGMAVMLSYSPAFIPGFAGSTSFYYTANVEPRGAHADDGTALGESSLAMFDTEFRYRPPKTGFEFRGEFAWLSFGNPAALRANNDGDPTNNVGSTMWGISGEVAYHFALGHALGAEWEAVPFYRYTYMNKQTDGFAGLDANLPTGAGQQQYHTVGVAVFPTPQVVLKLNYQKVIDGSPSGAMSDLVLGGVGFHF